VEAAELGGASRVDEAQLRCLEVDTNALGKALVGCWSYLALFDLVLPKVEPDSLGTSTGRKGWFGQGCRVRVKCNRAGTANSPSN